MRKARRLLVIAVRAAAREAAIWRWGRSEPFADRGKVSIVLPFRLQFLNPRVDSVNPPA